MEGRSLDREAVLFGERADLVGCPAGERDNLLQLFMAFEHVEDDVPLALGLALSLASCFCSFYESATEIAHRVQLLSGVVIRLHAKFILKFLREFSLCPLRQEDEAQEFYECVVLCIVANIDDGDVHEVVGTFRLLVVSDELLRLDPVGSDGASFAFRQIEAEPDRIDLADAVVVLSCEVAFLLRGDETGEIEPGAGEQVVSYFTRTRKRWQGLQARMRGGFCGREIGERSGSHEKDHRYFEGYPSGV